MSRSVTEESYEIRQAFYLQQKRNRTIERTEFLRNCLDEQIPPTSAPHQLRADDHPFTTSARAYLEDATKNLQNRTTVLDNRSTDATLPEHLKHRLRAESARHKANPQRKVDSLCEVNGTKQATML